MQPSGGQLHYKKETTRQRVDNPKTKHLVSRDGRPMHSPMHETVYCTLEMPMHETVYFKLEMPHSPMHETVYSTLEMPMHESVYFTSEMLHLRSRPTTIHVFQGRNASRSILFYRRNYLSAAHGTIYFTLEKPHLHETVYFTSEMPHLHENHVFHVRNAAPSSSADKHHEFQTEKTLEPLYFRREILHACYHKHDDRSAHTHVFHADKSHESMCFRGDIHFGTC